MTSIIQIALKDLRVIMRDWTALLMLFATPLLMILVLGMALGPIFAQGSSMEPAVLGVVDLADMEGLPVPSVSSVLSQAELGKYLETRSFATESQALDALGKGQLAAVLVVPEDFGRRIMAGEPVELQLQKDPGSTLGATIATTIVRQLADSWNVNHTAIMLAARRGVQDFASLDQSQPVDLDRLRVETSNVSPLTHQPTAFEYYAVSMSVLYLLFAANTASKLFLSEREEGTLQRMLALPVTRLQVVVGKLGGIVVLGVAQVAVLFAVTHFGYGVDFGDSPLGLALMILASVVAAMGLGAFIAALGRRPETADQLGVVLILTMSMIGGCMLPVYLFPDWLDKLSFLTFNRWSLEGFFTLMFEGGTVRDILLDAGVLFAMGAVLLAIAVPLTRFERSS